MKPVWRQGQGYEAYRHLVSIMLCVKGGAFLVRGDPVNCFYHGELLALCTCRLSPPRDGGLQDCCQ